MTQTLASSATHLAAPVVTIGAGSLRGIEESGIRRFLGIPYAAPPVGPLRFAAPQPPAPWSDERDATRPGFIAPQASPTPEEMERVLPGIDIAPLIGGDLQQGDDFLVLNVWAPAEAPAGLPTMVFIHGGAFTGGTGSADVYDGSAFARAGVVCVTINYRLGVEGFLPIPGAPTNLGLRDQIAALAWVRDNIAAFGGDPGNVTVFGESAGAMSIANLVASPLARGLFRRAIVQSGHGGMVRPVPVARRLTDKIAKLLRVPATVEGFRSRTIAEAVTALQRVSKPMARVDLRNPDGREPAFGLSRFLPVYGDDVLPDHPLAALEKGVGAEIDLLIGTNREEMNLYLVPSGVRRKLGKLLAHFIARRSEPNARAILRAYGIDERGRRAGDAFTEALTDLVFRLPARRFAQAHKGRTHVYDFSWRSDAYGGELGACHAIELPFVFNTLHTVSGPRGLAGGNPPQELADRMSELWVEFARTGALPWPEYDATTRIVHTPDTGVTAPEPPMPAEAFLP